MKNILFRKFFLSGLMTLAFALPSTFLSAQDAPPAQEKAPSKAELKKYDANGDGKLDDAEKAQMKVDEKAKRDAQHADDLAKYDTNKDGKLSKEERAAMKEAKDAEKAAAKAAKKSAKDGDSR